MDVNEELKFLRKFKKKLGGGVQGGGAGWWGGGGQCGCERKIEVFVKIQKKNFFGGWGCWGGGGRVGLGGQDGCERRIEVFVKIQKKKKKIFFFGGGEWSVEGGGVRVDVNEELKFL